MRIGAPLEIDREKAMSFSASLLDSGFQTKPRFADQLCSLSLKYCRLAPETGDCAAVAAWCSQGRDALLSGTLADSDIGPEWVPNYHDYVWVPHTKTQLPFVTR